MQGPIAQIVSLTLAGNALVQGKTLGNYWPDDPAFKFCRSIRFFDGDPDQPNDQLTEIAADPLLWLRLCAKGQASFHLQYQPSQQAKLSDRLSVGFVGGGGRWSVAVIGGAQASGDAVIENWQAHWRVGDRQAKDRRIWEVGYFRQRPAPMTSASIPLAEVSPADLSVALEMTLGAIAGFATAQKQDHFATCFRRAHELLRASSLPATVDCRALDPFNMLPEAALRLLLVTEAAWVFGGMGSWNDLGFAGEDRRRYDTLSDDLYRLLTQAIVTAVNQSAAVEPV